MIPFSGFLKALKEARLPCTKATVLKYERLGVIAFPKNALQHKDRKDRLYTFEEIGDNILKIRAHRKALKKN